MQKIKAILYNIYQWFPVIFLAVIWYIPRQTAPGGILEGFVFLRWTTFVIIPLWFLIEAVLHIYRKKPFRFTLVAVSVVFFGVIVFISSFVNTASFAKTVGTLLVYLRYPLLFLVLVNMATPRNIVKVFTLVFAGLLLIQIPECFYRFYVLGVKGDSLSWSLGPWGTFDLGVYMSYAFAILVASGVVKKIGIFHILLTVCFFALAVFGEIKGFLLAAPLVAFAACLAALHGFSRRRIMRMCVLMLLCAGCIAGTVGIWGIVHSKRRDEFTRLTSPQKREKLLLQYNTAIADSSRAEKGLASMAQGVYDRISKFPGIGRRVKPLATLVLYLDENPVQLWLGLGPGESFAGHFWDGKGKVHEYRIAKGNQLSSIVADTGIAGLLTFYSLLVIVLFRFFTVKHAVKDEKTSILLASSAGMWVFYAVLGPVYDLMWRHDASSYIFFFYSAMIYKYYYNEDAAL